MNQNLVFALRFDAKTGQFVTDVGAASRAVGELGDRSGISTKQLHTLDQQSSQLSSQLVSLRNQALALAGGFSIMAVAGDATRTLAQYQDMRTQITALVGGQREWGETEQYLIATASEHNKVLTSMAGNYARLASLQEAGLLTVDEMRHIFEGMSDVQSQTGASTVQLEQSMYGLSQALASPIVRAEELNQVVEPLPGLLNKLDKAAGLQAGGFRQLMLDGQITSDFFKQTLLKALNEYEGAAARTASNINAQYALLTNSYQQAVLAYEKPITDSLTPMLSAAGNTLLLFADNAQTVTTVVELSLVLALSRGAAAFGTMTAAKVADMLAERQRTLATIQATQTTLAATEAEIARLTVNRQQAVGAVMAARLEDQITAAKARHTLATQTLTAAQTQLNVVARAGAASLALMGGPAGVVMIAAGALAYFAATSGNTRKELKTLDTEVKNLNGSFDHLNSKQHEILVVQLNHEMSQTRESIISTQRQIEGLKNNLANLDPGGRSAARARIVELEEKIISYKNALIDASAKQQAVFNAGMPDLTTPTTPLGVSNTELSDGEKRLEQLTRQLALLGKSSELSKINFELEQGSLKTVAPALAEKLRLKAKEIDLEQLRLDTQQKAQTLNEQAAERLTALQSQLALYSSTGEAARLRWELEHGALKGVNEELAKNLLLEADKLDKLKGEGQYDTRKLEAFYEESDAIAKAYLLRTAIEADFENEARTREEFAYQEKQERYARQFEQAYQQATGDQQLQADLEREYFANREMMLADHEANLSEIERNAAMQRKQFQQGVAEDLLSFTEQQMNITTQFLRQAGKEQSGIYRALFAMQKMAAIPSMIIATEEAATKALTLGPMAGPLASAAVKTMGYASVGIVAGQAIAGQAHDGLWRVPTDNEGTFLLKRDEMVLNTEQAGDFRWMVGMMQAMKQTQQQQVAMQSTSSQPVNVSPAPVHVAFLDDQTQLNRYLLSDVGQDQVVEIVKRNKNRLGG
ncbi:tape measure protein [Vibrio cholerae]|nr:hypothetical protein [Vibrio cholerae]ELJ8687149.1 tape measure protein [Vibrio cholerae]HDZ9323805.1 tape measure protein [Vibrio cholerae]